MRALPHCPVDSNPLSFHRTLQGRAVARALALSAAAALHIGTAIAAPAANADAPGAPLHYAPLAPLGEGAEQGRTDWRAAHEALRPSAPDHAAHAGHEDHAAPHGRGNSSGHSGHSGHSDRSNHSGHPHQGAHAGHGDHAPAPTVSPPSPSARQHTGVQP